MALSAAIRALLNKFADTQPALRLAEKPLAASNPNLGTALGDAIDAAAAVGANGAYTPTTSTDWTGADPTTIKQALDRIAAALGPIA